MARMPPTLGHPTLSTILQTCSSLKFNEEWYLVSPVSRGQYGSHGASYHRFVKKQFVLSKLTQQFAQLLQNKFSFMLNLWTTCNGASIALPMPDDSQCFMLSGTAPLHSRSNAFRNLIQPCAKPATDCMKYSAGLISHFSCLTWSALIQQLHWMVAASYHAEFFMMPMKVFKSTVPGPLLLLFDASSTITLRSSDESLTWSKKESEHRHRL